MTTFSKIYDFVKNVRFPAGSELVKFCTKVLCHVHFYISSDANVTFAPLPRGEGQGGEGLIVTLNLFQGLIGGKIPKQVRNDIMFI